MREQNPPNHEGPPTACWDWSWVGAGARPSLPARRAPFPSLLTAGAKICSMGLLGPVFHPAGNWDWQLPCHAKPVCSCPPPAPQPTSYEGGPHSKGPPFPTLPQASWHQQPELQHRAAQTCILLCQNWGQGGLETEPLCHTALAWPPPRPDPTSMVGQQGWGRRCIKTLFLHSPIHNPGQLHREKINPFLVSTVQRTLLSQCSPRAYEHTRTSKLPNEGHLGWWQTVTYIEA